MIKIEDYAPMSDRRLSMSSPHPRSISKEGYPEYQLDGRGRRRCRDSDADDPLAGTARSQCAMDVIKGDEKFFVITKNSITASTESRWT